MNHARSGAGQGAPRGRRRQILERVEDVQLGIRVVGIGVPPQHLPILRNCREVQLAYRAAVRSCNRGIGNSKQAGGLPLEQVAALPPMGQLVKGGPCHPVAATVLASWWLLREIEASRARRKHITVNVTDRRVTWRLPSSKTDQAALGAERSHTCSCALHSPNLCPFHLMVGHLANLPEALDQPIFPAEDDQIPASKDGWADTFEQLAIHLGLPVTHNNGAHTAELHPKPVTVDPLEQALLLVEASHVTIPTYRYVVQPATASSPLQPLL